MRTAEDLDSYLLKLGLPYEQLKPGLWLIKPDAVGENLLVSIAGPVVAFRLKVMDQPTTGREECYGALLRLNTTEMVHGAFGLEESGAVVLVHSLELENLDFNEFSAVIDEFTMAAAKHYPALAKFRSAA